MGTVAMILNDLINPETTFQSPLGPAGVGVQNVFSPKQHIRWKYPSILDFHVMFPKAVSVHSANSL